MLYNILFLNFFNIRNSILFETLGFVCGQNRHYVSDQHLRIKSVEVLLFRKRTFFR